MTGEPHAYCTEHDQPLDWCSHEEIPLTWTAPDGSVWLYFGMWQEWTGWMPGEAGVWQRTVEEFRHSYPDAPPWDSNAHSSEGPQEAPDVTEREGKA